MVQPSGCNWSDHSVWHMCWGELTDPTAVTPSVSHVALDSTQSLAAEKSNKMVLSVGDILLD